MISLSLPYIWPDLDPTTCMVSPLPHFTTTLLLRMLSAFVTEVSCNLNIKVTLRFTSICRGCTLFLLALTATKYTPWKGQVNLPEEGSKLLPLDNNTVSNFIISPALYVCTLLFLAVKPLNLELPEDINKYKKGKLYYRDGHTSILVDHDTLFKPLTFLSVTA